MLLFKNNAVEIHKNELKRRALTIADTISELMDGSSLNFGPGMGRHGGGAFSGKDPSKVDRSAAYMGRCIAKTIVAAGLASRCELQVAYAIGVADPVSVMVDTFGTNTIPEETIEKRIQNVFNLKPKSIIQTLDLLKPKYTITAAYGHFGRNEPGFTWEQTDKAQELR